MRPPKRYEAGQILGGYKVIKDEGINSKRVHWITVQCLTCGTIYKHRQPATVKSSKGCQRCLYSRAFKPIPVGTRFASFEVLEDEGIDKKGNNKHPEHYLTVKCVDCGTIYKSRSLKSLQKSKKHLVKCVNCSQIARREARREKTIMEANKDKAIKYFCQKHGNVLVINKKGRGNGCMQCEYYTDCLLVFAKKMFVGWRFAEVV